MRSVHEGTARWMAAIVGVAFTSMTITPTAWGADTKAATAKPAAAAKGGAKKGKDDKRGDARKLYGEAEKKFASGDFGGAYDAYKGANDLVPAPQTLYKMAISLDKGDKVSEAVSAYKAFLDSSPPDSMASKVTESKQRVAELAKKLPATVTVASDPGGASISLDGTEQPGMTPVEIKVPAGHHKLHATLTGYEDSDKEIDVEGGATQDVRLTLNKAAPPPVAAAEPPPAAPALPPPMPPPTPAPTKSNTAAFVLLGIAGAGAVVGGIFGAKALQDKKDFDNGEKTNDKADSVERNALIADMAFGAALTLGVTGTVLLLSSGSGGSDSSPSGGHAMRLVPVIGMHTAGAGAVLSF